MNTDNPEVPGTIVVVKGKVYIRLSVADRNHYLLSHRRPFFGLITPNEVIEWTAVQFDVRKRGIRWHSHR